MIITPPSSLELFILRGIANYQFGCNVGKILIPDNVLLVKSPKTLRIRHVIDENKQIIVTLKPTTFMYVLHLKGGLILHRNFSMPRFRVVIENRVKTFIIEGRSVFCKHVIDVDPNIKAGDEVILVDESDNFIGVGKAKLNAIEMLKFNRGEAVRTRHTIREYELP
ncbi:MAG TPA: pseudouridine synthase [Desulfurococcales archaeon]|nr:pseudouridine synthase [Desulfurococcales archaeon]